MLGYEPGSPERAELQARLAEMAAEPIEIPVVIGGEEIRTGDTFDAVMPHDKEHVLAHVHKAGAAEVDKAIAASAEAWEDWHRLPWEERAAVFLRAAELLSGPWRSTLVAATMLNQSKTAHQAEIDAACEVIDFWRFNVQFMLRIYEEQPISSPGVWNRMEYRPLEGFVFAISPFNFTAIGANLIGEPGADGRRRALEAGLDRRALVVLDAEAARGGGPAAGRRQLPARAAAPRSAIRRSRATTSPGSTSPARPRSSTRSGRRSARTSTATATTRGSSARPAARTSSSRTRAPTWRRSRPRSCAARSSTRARSARRPRASTRPRTSGPSCSERLVEEVGTITMGDVSDFSNFMGAVIDGKSFARQREAIEYAKGNNAEVIAGGGTDDSKGYFVEPTVIQTKDPRDRLMQEEFFGPIVTTYVYPEDEWEQTLELVDDTAPYGLTGAIFSQERASIDEAQEALRYAAGNFYVNDKPTGAVVGQQPFGGSRASGTNDKAGSMWNLIRWVSPRTIKETFVPPQDYRYPFLDAENGDGSR